MALPNTAEKEQALETPGREPTSSSPSSPAPGQVTSVQELSQPSPRSGLWFTPLKPCKLMLQQLTQTPAAAPQEPNRSACMQGRVSALTRHPLSEEPHTGPKDSVFCGLPLEQLKEETCAPTAQCWAPWSPTTTSRDGHPVGQWLTLWAVSCGKKMVFVFYIVQNKKLSYEHRTPPPPPSLCGKMATHCPFKQ